MQMFQGSGAPASVKLPSVPSVPEVKKPGEPIKLPSFGIDAGTIALPGRPTRPSRVVPGSDVNNGEVYRPNGSHRSAALSDM